MALPLGIGFVTDPSEQNEAFPPFLDFVLVADQHRGKGVSTWLDDTANSRGARLPKALWGRSSL